MLIIDSCVWIAYFNLNDSQHQKAQNVFAKIKDGVVLTEYLIVEIASVLALRSNKENADKFLEFAQNNKDIDVILSDKSFFTRTVETFKNTGNNKLSFVDCSLLMLSEHNEVITFDKALIDQMSEEKRKNKNE
jgi:predicted nucleic acid-binding protein